MTLGEQIRAAREAKNLSQETLAEFLGVSRQAVSKWENNTSVPHGANMEALGSLLELNVSASQSTSEKAKLLPWIGWSVAAILLLVLIGLLLHLWCVSGGGAADNPSILSVRFYDNTQEEVLPADGKLFLPSYNSALVESILLQWSGNEPLEEAKLFFLHRDSQNPSQAELLEVKRPADSENALLFSSSYLHEVNRTGTLFFELRFRNGHTISSTESYHVYYENPYSRLAYVHSLTENQLAFDKVEWIAEDSPRAEALGLDNFPNGFHLHNEQTILENLPISEPVACSVINWGEQISQKEVSKEEFLSVLSDRSFLLCHITIENGVITSISEQYTP